MNNKLSFTLSVMVCAGVANAFACAGCEQIADELRDHAHDGQGDAQPRPDPTPVVCGTNTCKDSDYCCNASCGVCAPKGAACIQIACDPKPLPGACQSDSDCHAAADYCDGCNCRALATADAVPACTGKTVQCLRDPCGGQTAVCNNGACTLTSAPPVTPPECTSAAQCAAPQLCRVCPNGGYSCAQTTCDGGKCQVVYPPCDGPVQQ